MHPRLHFTTSLFLSLALHALVLAAALFLVKPTAPERPLFTPVRIVNLPQETIRKLPPLKQPAPPPVPRVPSLPKPIPPEKHIPPDEVPMPKKFGGSDEAALPKATVPRTGVPGGAEQGKETGKTGPQAKQVPKETGPLPFLTRKDIDEFARRGMPEKRPGEDSVTLDTDEFKFISYNRWLKIKVESVLKYPELAAVSGYQGALFIKFDILKDGSLGDVEVLKSSGYKILDDEALRSIRTAAPFQPLPDEWKMERYSIRAAVIFYLGEGYIR
jgi:protein TonB